MPELRSTPTPEDLAFVDQLASTLSYRHHLLPVPHPKIIRFQMHEESSGNVLCRIAVHEDKGFMVVYPPGHPQAHSAFFVGTGRADELLRRYIMESTRYEDLEDPE